MKDAIETKAKKLVEALTNQPQFTTAQLGAGIFMAIGEDTEEGVAAELADSDGCGCGLTLDQYKYLKPLCRVVIDEENGIFNRRAVRTAKHLFKVEQSDLYSSLPIVIASRVDLLNGQARAEHRGDNSYFIARVTAADIKSDPGLQFSGSDGA